MGEIIFGVVVFAIFCGIAVEIVRSQQKHDQQKRDE
jgi:L-cystine uptake protein TcyP (sodium:dicarboxylate symporter family)